MQIGETRPGKSDVLDIFPFTWENQRPAYRERALSGMSWGTGIDICALPLHKADSWWELSSVLCDDLEGCGGGGGGWKGGAKETGHTYTYG